MYRNFDRKVRNLPAVLKGRGYLGHSLLTALVDFVLWPSDVARVIKIYKEEFGVNPSLLQSKSFNEKLQRTKILNRKKCYTQYADKLSVRDYVAGRVGKDILNDIFWIGTDLREVDKKKLPDKFVIKSNHCSGQILVVEDAASFDWGEAEILTSKWLSVEYSALGAEWQYRWIEPKLFIERHLGDIDGKLPVDYKFFCFKGKVKFIQVDYDRFENHTRALYDVSFKPLPVSYHFPRFEGKSSPPVCLLDMIRVAELLSSGEDFLRVDLYDQGRVIFGELTLHPGNGKEKFLPEEWDLMFGALWQ